jgi:multidrug resistance efflux pump
LESEAARAASELQVATGRATQAQLRYAAFGPAERERQQLAERNRVLSEQVAKLQVISPIAGIVQTPRLHDLLGSYVTAGTVIAEVADSAGMLARVYVPEFQMRDVRVGAPAVVLPESRFTPISGTLHAVAEVSSAVPVGLVERSQLQGIRPPTFYMTTVQLDDSRGLKEGMSGTAKIFVRRRNLLSFGWRFARGLVERRLW